MSILSNFQNRTNVLRTIGNDEHSGGGSFRTDASGGQRLGEVTGENMNAIIQCVCTAALAPYVVVKLSKLASKIIAHVHNSASRCVAD